MSAQSDVQKSLPGRLPPDVGWLDPLRFIRCLPSAAEMCVPPRMSAGVE